MGEKTSMFYKMFEKDDQYDQQDVDDTHCVQANNLGMGDCIPREAATGFRGHGGDPIQDTPGGEDHGQKAYAAKGHWSPEEDELLLRHMEHHNTAWSDIAKELPGRTGKQCRERWINHLDSKIEKRSWTDAEETELVRLHMELGKKWSQIAKQITGRPENTIKNQWYATERSVDSKLKNNKEISGVLESYIRSLKEGNGTQQGVLPVPVHAAAGSGHKVTMPFFAGSSSFFAGSSSQAPALGGGIGNPLPLPLPSFPDLNGGVVDDFPMEAMYEDSLTLIPTQETGYLINPNGDDVPMEEEAPYEGSFTLTPPAHQETVYYSDLNADDDDFPMEATYKDSLIPARESGYLPSPYAPPAPEHHQFGSAGDYLAGGGGYSIQPPPQAFFNYHQEDPVGQVFAGRYYHKTGRDQVLPGLYYHHAEPSYYGGGGGNPTGGFSEAAANNGFAMPPARANEEAGPSSLNPPPAPGGYF